MLDAQRCYDVIQAVKQAGMRNTEGLIQYMLIHTGVREDPVFIRRSYADILDRASRHGYTDPMDFLRDYFPGGYLEALATVDEPIDRKRLHELFESKGLVPRKITARPEEGQSPAEPPARRAKPAAAAEGLSGRQADSKTDSKADARGDIKKPEKIFRGGVPGSPIEIPPAIKAEIVKNKRASKYYREFSPREREIDNRFDYFMMQAQRDESGKFFHDNREAVEEFPLVGTAFSDIDSEFRRVMAGIYSGNTEFTKDKNKWVEEMKILREYFQKKVGMEAGDELSSKRLAFTVAHLMKKLQHKIFDTENPRAIRALVYFKLQLSAFYNFYRK